MSTTTSFAGYPPRYSSIKLEELADTDSVITPTNGQTLVYDSTAAKWGSSRVYDVTTVTTDTTTAGPRTYTAAELIGGLILRDCAGAIRSDVTPTAALLVAALPDAIVGTSFRVVIRNTSDAAETLTITGGTGVTVSGTATIAQNNSKEFLVRLDNVTAAAEAVTVYSMGTAVF